MTSSYGGFHKIDLKEPVTLQRNQYYSVILTQKTPEGKYNINGPMGISKDLAMVFSSPYWVKGTKKWKKVKIGATAKKKVLKKLKKGKRYQVQARDYIVYNGKTVYSSWSKVKTSKKIK